MRKNLYCVVATVMAANMMIITGFAGTDDNREVMSKGPGYRLELTAQQEAQSAEVQDNETLAAADQPAESGNAEAAEEIRRRQEADRAELLTFKITIAGTEISVPVTGRQLEPAGWTITGDGYKVDARDNVLVKNDYLSLVNGDMDIMGKRTAVAESDTPLNEDVIHTLKISRLYLRGAEAVLPGGIILGQATTADLTAAYGEPSYVIKEGPRGHMQAVGVVYKLNEYQYIEFYHTGSSTEYYEKPGEPADTIKSVIIRNDLTKTVVDDPRGGRF